MSRKRRTNVTKDIHDLVISMAESDQCFTNMQIAELVNVSVSCVKSIIRKNGSGVEFESSSCKRKNTWKVKNATFSAIEQHVFTAVVSNNELIQSEIVTDILENSGVKLSQPTVSRKLKKIGFSRKRLCKVPIDRNSAAVIQGRAIYAATIGRITHERLVFLDESGFNQHTSRHYGYSLINQKAYKTVRSNRGTNKSLICAINFNGVVAFKHRTGAYNKQLLVDFVENDLAPYFRRHPDHYLVMDNVRFHHALEVKNKLNQLGINHDYLPAYSPQLNPIEEFFSMLKAKYCSLKVAKPEITIENALTNLLLVSRENDYSSQCHGFFLSMGRWIEKARQRLPFI